MLRNSHRETGPNGRRQYSRQVEGYFSAPKGRQFWVSFRGVEALVAPPVLIRVSPAASRPQTVPSGEMHENPSGGSPYDGASMEISSIKRWTASLGANSPPCSSNGLLNIGFGIQALYRAPEYRASASAFSPHGVNRKCKSSGRCGSRSLIGHAGPTPRASSCCSRLGREKLRSPAAR